MGVFNLALLQWEASTVPDTFDTLVVKYNAVFNTNFTTSSIQGTQDGNNLLIFSQEFVDLDNDISELQAKFTDGIALNQIEIAVPTTTTEDLLLAFNVNGYNANLKPLAEPADAGTVRLVIEKNSINFATNLEERNILAKLFNDHLAEGVVTVVDAPAIELTGQVELSNGQTKPMKFTIPTETLLYIRATILFKSTNPEPFQNEATIATKIEENFSNVYLTGSIVSPDRYLSIANDIPFANNLIMEFSNDGVVFNNEVSEDDYFIKRLLTIARITVILTEIA